MERTAAVQPEQTSSKQPLSNQKVYFFCGIGGSGMSALARLVAAQGHIVLGSDRSYDQGQSPEKFQQLINEGFKLFPQDGSGLDSKVDHLVVSSAVEQRIPDVKRAKELDIHILKRAELLSESFNAKKGVSIAGTSGKTTVTAMTGYVFTSCDQAPIIVNGGLMLNFTDEHNEPQNTVAGKGDYFIAETDESDGSIELYNPYIALVNNIALDHKPLEELRSLFTDFVGRARKGCVLNVDNFDVKNLKNACSGHVLTFGIENEEADLRAVDIKPSDFGISFKLQDSIDAKTYDVQLNVPGFHNVSNALAAIAIAKIEGLDVEKASQSLSGFKGTRRRLEVIGENECGALIIDDFAHNPDKLAASLSALKYNPGRLLIMYQPHGFKPTQMLREGLVDSLVNGMGDEDIVFMPEIYYAGGTVDKVISAGDLADDINAGGKKAVFTEKRSEITPLIKAEMRRGDRIVIMGARDDTLTDFCREFL